jgi:hypothetical protein
MQNRSDTIKNKANEIMNLSQEIMTSDVLIPHFINILEELDGSQTEHKTKISALEVLNILTKK